MTNSGRERKLRPGRVDLYEQLLEVARRYFDRVEEESGDFRGGICRVRGEKYLVLNRQAKLERKLSTVASALSSLDLDQQYLLPAVREAIDRYSEL
ncbi:MAG TPA: hypothetical protein ENH10_06405 [Bacteroidetes bacterium]|nr:hypothetical protein BMS3Bbin04_00488 [bacterium BMS3Bbin04]HDO65649.1 hypothetical protein [Bacteroidota bacterium]HEX04774.1 hypothetical protein [Bacteroidota bacterium]